LADRLIDRETQGCYPLTMTNLRSYLLNTCAVAGALFVVSLSGETVRYDLRLEAAEWERRHLPVEVDLPLREGGQDREWSGTVRSRDGVARQAQVEVLRGAESVRVYWIEPGVAAGKTVDLELVLAAGPGSRAGSFRFELDEEGQELLRGEVPVYRYVTTYDPQQHADTHKPYHQIYRFSGEGFITKGPGGVFPHHKGVYLGWNRTRLASGATHDFWHAPREFQKHRSFARDRELTGPVLARSVSSTDWITPQGEVAVRDQREVRTWSLSEDELLLDFTLTIQPVGGDIRLGGDAHHAGFQFRAAQEVAENAAASTILHPPGAERLEGDLWAAAPWMAMSFDVGGEPYTVVHMDHVKENPDNTTYSTRTYGRFGAFFSRDVTESEPLVLRYRLLVIGARDEERVSVEALQARHRDFIEPPVVRVLHR
jgi:hypothetical protein